MLSQTLDETTFAARVEPFRTRVHAYCTQFLRDITQGEDITQEVFARAWEHRAAYRGDDPLEHWLLRIARNVCLNTVRTKKETAHRHALRLDAPEVVTAEPSAPEPPPFDRVVMQQVTQALKQRLDTRDYFILRCHLEKMSDQEIAATLPPEWKLGVDGVHSRLQRTIKRAMAEVRQ